MRIILLLTLSLWFLEAATQVLRIGDRLPEYTFRTVGLKGSDVLQLSDLKGKTILIDFWATWCLPCLGNLRQLNEMIKQVRKDVVVLAVSDEPENRIRDFLTNTGYPFYFIADSGFRKYFPHKVIPHSVIIDQSGIIRAITSPAEITTAKLEAVLQNENVAFKTKNDFEVEQDPESRPPLLQVEVVPFDKEKSTGIVAEDSRLQFNNFTIPSLFREAFRLESHSWIVDSITNQKAMEYKPENLYSLRLQKGNDSRADLYEVAQEVLNSTFPVEAAFRPVSRVVFVLRVIDKKKVPVSGALAPSVQFYGPVYTGIKQPMKTLVWYLSNEIGAAQNDLVADETGLQGEYDIRLQWAYENPGSLQKELEKHGLKLFREQRTVPCLVLKDAVLSK